MASMARMCGTSLMTIELSIKGIDVPGKREETTSNEHATKEQKKLVLSEKMKVALVSVGLFSEEQAEAISNETQVNLSEDF